MNIRKAIVIGLVAVAAVPAYALGLGQLGPKTETVVEGHNVFAVLQAAVNRNLTGVTVLVREEVISGGKLWFNDQYLVRPDQAISTSGGGSLSDCGFKPGGEFACFRYPCGGAVIATESGNPNPAAARGYGRFINDTGQNINSLTPVDLFTPNDRYVESYYITDPNDHTFIIDKYIRRFDLGDNTSSGDFSTLPPQFPSSNSNSNAQDTSGTGVPIGNGVVVPGLGSITKPSNNYAYWVVNILGAPTFTADDGVSNCPAFVDNPPAGFFEPTDPAFNGGASYCYDGNPALAGETPGGGCAYDAYASGTSFTIPTQVTTHNYRRYNAEFVFFMTDLAKTTTKGAVLHGTSSSDTNGCEAKASDGRPTEWYCPGGNDNKEGNSHPFNPNDGGSGTPDHRHDTAKVDLYYSPDWRPNEPTMAQRIWKIFDTEGSTAPFDLRH